MNKAPKTLAVVAVVAVLVGAGLGFWAARTALLPTGSAVGRADIAAAGGGSLSAPDWSYQLPADVPWTGADGVDHDGGSPECLKYDSPPVNVLFSWVEVNVDGSHSRQVVHVDCRYADPVP
jgi:hypothetical protein